MNFTPVTYAFPPVSSRDARLARRRSLAFWCLAAGITARLFSAGPMPSVTSQEIVLTADWNEDGREDLAVVDRATGLVRVGLVAADGSVSWGQPLGSGLQQVTGATPVRFAGGPRELALASPAFNRLNVTRLGDGTFRELFPSGFQPEILADTGNALWVASQGNGAPQPYGLEGMVPAGAGFVTTFSARSERGTRQLASSPIQTGQAMLAWQLETGGTDTRLRVLAAGGPAPVEQMSVVVPGSVDRFAVGFRPASTLASVLLFGPSESAVSVRTVVGTAPAFSLGPPLKTPLPGPVAQVLWAGADVVALAADGSAAWELKFNPEGGLVLAGTLVPAEGVRFSGGHLDGGALRLLHRAAAEDFSTGLSRYQRTGATWAPAGTMALPGLHPLLGTANVFLFDGEPFTDPAARLVRSFSLGAWTSDLRLDGNASVGVETFSGAGLGSPGRRPLPGPTSGVPFGVANQSQPHLSLFSFAPPFLSALPPPEPDPTPGSHAAPIQVAFAVPRGTTVLFRRSTNEPWAVYSAPISIPATRTLWWFQRNDSAQSPVRSGTFTITTPPAALDSDGDGVSDAVETSLGLDPVTSGPDVDGDGATDAQEVAARTNPADPTSRPEPGSAPVPTIAFALSPRGVDGSAAATNEVRAAAPGTGLTVWLPSGATAASLVQDDALAAPGNAREVRAAWSFLAAATPPVFPMVSPGGPRDPGIANLPRGRELLAILPLPPAEGFASGDLGTRVLSDETTLATAVFEARLEVLLQTRLGRAREGLTLVPGRAGEGSRVQLTLGDLAALSAGGDGFSGVDLKALWTGVLADTTSVAWSPVRSWVRALFRASSRDQEEGAEGLPLPFDVLRRFVRGRPVDPAVLRALRLDPAAISTVQALVTAPRPVPARPVIQFVAQVAGAGDDGCPRVRRVTDGVTFALVGTLAQNVAGAGFDSRVDLTAYADALAECEATALEPIAFSVLAPDPLPRADRNGNQIPDAWEDALAGRAGGALGDADQDLVSNRAELEAGTDPFDAASKPSAPVPTRLLVPPSGGAVLAGRPFALRVLADGALPLTFQWERNGTALAGRTTTELAFLTVTPADAGEYRVRVSGAGGVVTSEPVTLTVLQTNRPPAFASLPVVTNIPEESAWILPLAVIDPDEGQLVNLSLLEAPTGLTLDSAVPRLRWTPTEAQGPSTNRVRVVATDSANPPASTTNLLTIVVQEVNRPPAWTPPGPVTVAEGTTLRITLSPTDADLPQQTLALSLVSAPAGSELVSRQFAWTPTEVQGPSTNRVRVRVDDGVVAITNEFSVVATEVNLRPELAPVADRSVRAGETLAFTLLASDADLPPQHLAFSVVSGPVGFGVNPDSGAVVWAVPANASVGTFPATVGVSDDGEPLLRMERTFSITVTPGNRPPLRIRVSLVGTRLRLEWDAVVGDRFRLERQNALRTGPWESFWTGTASATTAATEVDLPASAGFFRLVRID